MDQLAQQAHALKIYEEVTNKLYQVLKQLQIQRHQMETRISGLQNELERKDRVIKDLQQRLNYSVCNTAMKQNFVSVALNIQSEPLLGQRQQARPTSIQSFNEKGLKIDINTYFKGLINSMTHRSSQNQLHPFNSGSQNQKIQRIVKQCKSCQKDQQITSNLGLQKDLKSVLNLKQSKILTRVHTSQSNPKQLDDNTQNKENVNLLSHNQSTCLFLPFQFQLSTQNSNKIQQHKLFTQKENLTAKTNHNTLNATKFLGQNVKPRKPSFGIPKYLSSHS